MRHSRHTFITELAEKGVLDQTIQAIAGHLSKRMLDHYSHIRIAAKGAAVEDLDDWREAKRQQPQADAQTETLQ